MIIRKETKRYFLRRKRTPRYYIEIIIIERIVQIGFKENDFGRLVITRRLNKKE